MIQERKQTVRLWFWRSTALVIVIVFFGAHYLLRDQLPVRVARVEHGVLQNTVSTNGRMEPVVNYPFYSPLPTTVKAVYVQTGDTVRPGKLLMTLDDVDARSRVATAQSSVRAAQAALNAAMHNGTQAERQTAAAEVEQDRLTRDLTQHNLDALTRLASTGAASQGEVTAAREQLATAQASLNAAEQTAQHRYSPDEIARAQAAVADAEAALAAARHIESQTSIYAPIAGTVYTMDAAPAEYAEAGKLLLQMADLHQVRVRAYFDEPDLGRLAIGQSVLIHWDAKPDREWHGHIARLPVSVVTYTTRNVGEVLVSLDDSEEGLLPDTNVTATVTISSEPNALSMPREALHEQNGKYFVYKVVDKHLKRVPVTIGSPTLTEVSILSGLVDGDVVATGTTNGQPLQEGVTIKEAR